LYLGNDNHFVKLANSGNVDIRAYQPDSPYNSATWTFGTDGVISTTDNLIINVPNGVPSGVTSWIGQGGWNQGFYSNITASGGTGTGLTVDVAAGGAGYINIETITINTAGTGYTNGDIVTINNENNLPGTFIVVVAGTNSWEFNIDGDLVFPDSTIQTTAFIPTALVTTSSFNSLTASLSGVISGSPQLTSSFDTRYILSGSVVSGTTPSGTISGSSQLTSSFDSRYVLETETGSLQTSIISLNIWTSSAATTGSNAFNGNQTITGSLVVSSIAVVTGGITIPTGSTITLTSGSNLYVQNNGLVEITGSLNATSITGSIAATNGVISGSSQLTTAFPSKTTGTWTIPTGASTQSLSVEANSAYTMWVNGNIPNGIITWNATATISNTNVPVVGAQYGWYYAVGNALVLTAMPDQFTGTNGSILTTPGSYAPNTSNVFKFGITNNSGTTQTINYGYIKLS
jgi:hypothetical protein